MERDELKFLCYFLKFFLEGKYFIEVGGFIKYFC